MPWSRYFCKILLALSSNQFYTNYVFLPDTADPTPLEIHNNPCFYPYFRNALDAIDGTHIACSPSARECAASHDRKGLLTQNCLMACGFDLCFLHVLSGWEGSAADLLFFMMLIREAFLCLPVIYTPPPIPVGLRLFQKVRSDSGRTNWIPVDSS